MIRLRNKIKQAALVLGLLVPAASAAGAAGVLPGGGQPPEQPQPARQAIAQGEIRWSAAWQTHDAQSIAALFAADGLEMGRGGVVTQGRPAVTRRFARLFGAIGPVQASRQTADIWLVGRTAYESGRYAYTFPALRPGQKPNVMAGNYVAVWQQQKNGTWLIHSEVSVSVR